jgi:ketosteroid isomerase-like protein
MAQLAPMTPDDFVRRYEQALGSQQWDQVAPLIHENACVTFSTGQVHKGKPAVRRAFESNFSRIEDERYEILDVHWSLRDEHVAVYLFDFEWAGRVDGREVHGAGRGTSVLVGDGGSWQLLVEHLGPAGSAA